MKKPYKFTDLEVLDFIKDEEHETSENSLHLRAFALIPSGSDGGCGSDGGSDGGPGIC